MCSLCENWVRSTTRSVASQIKISEDDDNLHIIINLFSFVANLTATVISWRSNVVRLLFLIVATDLQEKKRNCIMLEYQLKIYIDYMEYGGLQGRLTYLLFRLHCIYVNLPRRFPNKHISYIQYWYFIQNYRILTNFLLRLFLQIDIQVFNNNIDN